MEELQGLAEDLDAYWKLQSIEEQVDYSDLADICTEILYHIEEFKDSTLKALENAGDISVYESRRRVESMCDSLRERREYFLYVSSTPWMCQ